MILESLRTQNAQAWLAQTGKCLKELDRGFVMDLYSEIPESVMMRATQRGDDRWALYQGEDHYLLEFAELGAGNEKVYRAIRLEQSPTRTQIGEEFLRRLTGWIGSVPQLSEFDTLRAVSNY